jgi:fermentation-respiration switch protein FrsA (DUF1100 family)
MGAIAQMAVIGVIGYVALAGWLYFSQERLVFLPELPGRTLVATPEAVGLAYRSLEIETADGERLHAWLVPCQPRRATLLFLHGNAGNISHRLDSLRQFHSLGLEVLIVDYRGYGQSTGRPSEQGTYRDAEAAWRFIVGELGRDPREVVVFGRSLGAAVGGWLAAHVASPPGAVILESAFTSAPDLGAEVYPWLPVRTLARVRYPLIEHIPQIRSPLLIVHSRDDEIVPIGHAEALYQASGGRADRVELRGGHNDGFLVTHGYLPAIAAFLDRHLPPEDKIIQ